MIELRNDSLVCTFPGTAAHGTKLIISFMKTLRVPDDGRSYPLPPGLGLFPLGHVDDYRQAVPESWNEHGGVMLPMYQSEAMWIDFRSSYVDEHEACYPFAVKVAAGKMNAITGEFWSNGLSRDPQDYMVVPGQPWLDGYSVEKGFIRQFVAMPLGEGYSAEGQITGSEDVGGLQIAVYPMKKEAFEKRWPRKPPIIEKPLYLRSGSGTVTMLSVAEKGMGMAAGGRIRQEIYEDRFDLSEWDMNTSSRCFVHLANSQAWRAITGNHPSTKAPTAKQYSSHGLPWFDYYSDRKSLLGSDILNKLKSVIQFGKARRQNPLPENDSVDPGNIIRIGKSQSPDQVREWSGRSE